MKNVFTPTVLLHILIVVLAIFMLNFPFVIYPELVSQGHTWLGLDVSWQMTLNYALVNDWVWGKDIVYTYGPLGFLSTRLSLGISRWIYLIFDLFVIYNFYHLFKDFVFTATDKFLAILTIIITTLLVNTSHGSDLSWVITAFIYYWMYKSYKEDKTLYFILMVINIVLCFYIKLNAGLIGIVFLGGHLLNLLIFKETKLLKAVVIFLSTLLLVYITALLLNVNLPGYIKGAFDIIKGYNDSMHIDREYYGDATNELINLYYVLIALHLIYAWYIIRQKEYSLFFFLGISFAYVFLLRKQSIVRNDVQHYAEFFSYVTLVLLVGYLHVKEVKWNRVFVSSTFVVVFVSILMLAGLGFKVVNVAIDRRYASLGTYFSSFMSYNDKPALHQKNKRFIPRGALKKIGKASIDVFPWDSEYLIENHLNYTPRPVFQSFSAYTERLQWLNYEFYAKKSPQFILYDYESIDGRYPFNDDAAVNLFICKNYTFADSFKSYEHTRLLLQRKTIVQALDFQNRKEEELKLTDTIGIDWEQINYIKIEVEHTLAGKMESFFNSAPRIDLKMTRLNGHVVKYKTSKELLKSGIVPDRWVRTTPDFLKYLENKENLDHIRSVKVIANQKYFKNQMKVTYITVK